MSCLALYALSWTMYMVQRSVLYPILRRPRLTLALLTIMLTGVVLYTYIDLATVPPAPATSPPPELHCDTTAPCVNDGVLRRSARRGTSLDLGELGQVSTISVLRAGTRNAPAAPKLQDSVLDLSDFETGNYRIYVVLNTGTAFEVLLAVLP